MQTHFSPITQPCRTCGSFALGLTNVVSPMLHSFSVSPSSQHWFGMFVPQSFGCTSNSSCTTSIDQVRLVHEAAAKITSGTGAVYVQPPALSHVDESPGVKVQSTVAAHASAAASGGV